MDAREVDGQRAERVVAVDADDALGGRRLADRLEVLHHEARIEEHVREPHEVPGPRARRVAKRSRRSPTARPGSRSPPPARLLQAPRLAAEAVELVAIVSTRSGRRVEARVDARDELVRVGRERDLPRIGQAEEAGDVRLRVRHHFAEHALPLAVGERGRVGPVARVRRSVASGHGWWLCAAKCSRPGFAARKREKCARARGSVLDRLDVDAQEHVVAQRRQPVLHAEVAALDVASKSAPHTFFLVIGWMPQLKNSR